MEAKKHVTNDLLDAEIKKIRYEMGEHAEQALTRLTLQNKLKLVTDDEMSGKNRFP